MKTLLARWQLFDNRGIHFSVIHYEKETIRGAPRAVTPARELLMAAPAREMEKPINFAR